MNALKQYIELFDEHKDLVNSNGAPLLNDFRDKARGILENMTLPAKGTENYEHSDLNEVLAPDYGINIARQAIAVNPAASFKCDVPNMSTALFFLINDSWACTDNSYNKVPEGVVIDSLRRVATNNSELIADYYGKVAEITNPIVALNTMLAQDGLVVYIPKNTIVEKPIQLVNIFQNASPLLAFRRLLIIAEENSQAQLLVCDHTQNQECDFLSVQTVEIVAKRGARFDLYDLEESSKKTNRLSALYIRQEQDSNVLVDGITLTNGKTRNEYYARLDGTHAELSLLGMGIEDEERSLDTYSHISHNVSDCQSNELFKYVLDDNAKGAFCGRIYVAPYATKTEAYQANRNIVVTDTAKMHSKPQLEIYNDDVKCSHGTAIGQLDAQQIFYMRARGLSEETAKVLLKQAFMSDVIDGVRLPALKDRLRMLVEKRFSGADASCANCGVDCKNPLDQI